MSQTYRIVETFRPGQIAQESGEYDVLDKSGAVVAVRLVTKGDPFPPTSRRGQVYSLKRIVHVTYTTATSAAAMEETSTVFSQALKSLAKK